MGSVSLVTPVGSNFLKDWSGQNAINCDSIDSYAGGQCLTSHPIGTYTPVLSAVTTPPSIGAGTIGGFYYKIFDQIFTWGFLRLGAGFSAGSGVWTISLPFQASTPFVTPNTALGGGPMIGNGFVWDDSAAGGRQPVSVQLRTDQTIMFGLRMNSGAAARELTNLAPITWVVDDGIKWSARYRRS